MKEKTLKNDLNIFRTKKIMTEALEKTKKEYRVFDPGAYLYRKLFDVRHTLDDSYLELVYVTLSAWNMNARGAKLQDFEVFKESIKSYSKQINKLKKESIKNWNDDISNQVETLFMNLNIVAEGKPLLVTFSKTMHFILPNLIVPIDRKYTLTYFFNNSYVSRTKYSQYKMFNKLHHEFAQFSKSVSLIEYIDSTWNLCETKIIDNMIIGYQKLQK